MIVSKRDVVALLALMVCGLAPLQQVLAQVTTVSPANPVIAYDKDLSVGCGDLDLGQLQSRINFWQSDMCNKQIGNPKDNTPGIWMSFAPDALIHVRGVDPVGGHGGALKLYMATLPKTTFATFGAPTGYAACRKAVFVGTYNLYWPPGPTSAVKSPGLENNEYDYSMTIEPKVSGYLITSLHLVRKSVTAYSAGTTAPTGNCVPPGK